MHKNDDKFLFIMRHGKSDQTWGDVSDFDRRLNARGEEETKIVGGILNNLKLEIAKAIVSTSRRTVDTWVALEKALNNPPEVAFDKRLYNAYFEDAIGVLIEEAQSTDNLMMIGHNPSVSEMCEYFSGETCELKPASCVVLKPKDENLLASLQKPSRFTIKHFVMA